MQKYDPMCEPEAEQWRALDEDERISMVIDFHQDAGIDLPDELAHALVHVIVENQIALQDETRVRSVLNRLIDENLDRHDAVHAIASILTNHIYLLMGGEDPTSGNDDYYAELEKLTADKWSSGEYSDG